ncbi:dnaJ protein 2 [Artemisia annua]|uniref:DnaJ protein 2 n=1 Tax=Artemisia annua TaxID=35608 RepID=A0A2U1LJW1_ARTAN|nr:dnaJ protein 2 [Artemisia annua]
MGSGTGHDPFDIFQSFFGNGASHFGGAPGSSNDKDDVGDKMLLILSKCLLRIFIGEPLRKSPFHVMYAAPSVKGYRRAINDKDRCTQCKGEKLVQEKKVLEVHVEKGMQNGQKIISPGEAAEAFKELAQSYEVLSNPKKQEIYDQSVLGFMKTT